MSSDENSDLDQAYSLSGPADNRRFYGDWAATYDAEFVQTSGYRLARVIAEAFVAAGGMGPVLDVGCGTGLVAEATPPEIVFDGVDISPEMLAQAARKRRYRALIEADLTQALSIPDASYDGLTSAGTFTHGHVGPEALPELMRVLRPGALCAVSGRSGYFETAGFDQAFRELATAGVITEPTRREERIYEAGAAPPEGHADDLGYVIVFRRL